MCKSCEELKRHVDCYANIIIHNPDDREEDEYRLILNTVPDPSSHFCSPSGKKIDSISCPTISVSKLFNLNHIGIASLVILAGGRHFFYGCIKIVLIQVLNVLSTDLNEKLFTHWPSNLYSRYRCCIEIPGKKFYHNEYFLVGFYSIILHLCRNTHFRVYLIFQGRVNNIWS